MTDRDPPDDDPIGRPGDWRRHDADLVRAAAALLIANSHLELFYPRGWMAGDGLTGNALFFFLSGFGIALSGGPRRKGFGPWYVRRALRLYPAVVVAELVLDVGLFGDWREWSVRKVGSAFVYPTTYGYVGHIMVVYAGLYWLLRPASRVPLAAATAGCVATCIGLSAVVSWQMVPGRPLAEGNPSLANTSMHWFYFTALTLAGAWFGPATRRPRGMLGRDLGLLAGLFAVYVGLKFQMVSGHGPRAFLILFAMVAGLCPLAVRVSADDRVQRWVRAVRPAGWAVSLLAAGTLEMYVVQTWTHGRPALIGMRFPLNVAAFWAATFAGAAVLWVVGRGLQRGAGYVAARAANVTLPD